MQAKISNVLRIQHAEIALEPGRITCIAGPNASGKTSIATIVGALLAGDGNPVGASKGQGKVYLRDGTDAGIAELHNDADDPIVRWIAQTGELSVVGGTPQCAAASVGLVDFTAAASPAARVATWEPHFLPPVEVLEARFRAALAPHIESKLIDDLMAHLRDEGDFSGTVKAYQSRMRDEKRAWTRITGEEWGVRKAADWIPDGWLADLDVRTNEDMDAAFASAEEALRAVQLAHAVDASVIARADEARAALPAAEAERAERNGHLQRRLEVLTNQEREVQTWARRMQRSADSVSEAEHAVRVAKRNLEALSPPRAPDDSVTRAGLERLRAAGPPERRPPNTDDVIQCPCGKPLVQVGGVLVFYDAEAAERAADERHAAEVAEHDQFLAEEAQKVEAIEARHRADFEARKHAYALEHEALTRAVKDAEAAFEHEASLLETAKSTHAEAVEPVSAARAHAQDAQDAWNDADRKVAVLASTIAEGEGKVARTEDMIEAHEEAERHIESVRAQRVMVRRRFDARTAHENIIAYQTIAKLLGPQGVRAQAVEEAMESFRGVLRAVARVTGWPAVGLDQHYTVSIGERPLLRLCSESERLRAQWSLQIALARVCKDPVVILDAADHLDQSNMAALRRLLATLCDRAEPLAFLVCGTEIDLDAWNPDGLNYTLEDGRAVSTP